VRPLPPSLRNPLAEYESDLGFPRPTHGDLSAWVAQGVLLLNRVLPVQHGEDGSHRGWGWEQVTDAVVEGLLAHHAQAGLPLVALLWGRDAQTLVPRLRAGGAEVLTSPHPSPLSDDRGFLGLRPFTRTNALLDAAGAAPIDWRLPSRQVRMWCLVLAKCTLKDFFGWRRTREHRSHSWTPNSG
jgi:uracil-DNA glycosylase